MAVNRIRRFGVGAVAAAVLVAGGVVAVPPAPASAIHVCAFNGPELRQKVRYGSTGISVSHLQCVLNDIGYKLDVDGKFGKATLSAVKNWQKRHPYLGPVDGVVGPKTWKSLIAASKTY